MLRRLLVFAGVAIVVSAFGTPAGTGVAVAGAGPSATPLQTFDVRGGDAFFTSDGARCTIGFSVAGGHYITAGLCGSWATTVLGHNQVVQGTVVAASFPNPGTALVRVNPTWIPRPLVNRHNGGTVSVRGGQPAPVGSTVCQSGSTSGWRCGTIVARNVTVAFPQGTLHGLIRTNICLQPGDLGAPLMSGDQAQGIFIGGFGNCTTGGASFYIPISEPLTLYGRTLLTAP